MKFKTRFPTGQKEKKSSTLKYEATFYA